MDTPTPTLIPHLAEIAEQIRAERPATVMSPLGELEVDYRLDDEDEPYAYLALTLPGQVLCEIDGETYGRLHGLRIPLGD